MLNIFKKSDGSQQSVGGGKGSDLEPPKNLPDLAGDIYENGYRKSSTNSDSDSNVSSQSPISPVPKTIMTQTPLSSSLQTPLPYASAASISPLSASVMSAKPVVEPSKDLVPKFDISLLKQQPVSQQNYAQHSYLQQVQSSPQQPVQQSVSYPYNIPYTNLYGTPQMNWNNILSSKDEFGVIDDSTGFFREFEKYIHDNGLNNNVIDDLLDKNLLDHMIFYHTAKGGDMPFYASGAELSHAIKLKLENLQNVERTWILNKQKLDVLKKLGINMESDIHMMSEELKRLMSESRKRGVSVKSSDFFQIMKPAMEPNVAKQPAVDNIDNSHVNNIHVDNPNDINVGNSEKDITKRVPAASAVHISMLPHPNLSKYILNNYIVGEESKYFYAKNGQIFKSLSDLISGLEFMDSGTFEYHVTEGKNDFSSWIKGVFGDLRLSDSIRPLDSREKLWYYLRNNTL